MRALSQTFRCLKRPISNPGESKPCSSSTRDSATALKNMKSKPKPKPWCVYLIISSNFPIKSYVGVTVNFNRRLKQHNGEIRGGAKATRAGRPWICACIIHGFEDQSQACEFESKWKKVSRKTPHKRMKKEEEDNGMGKQIDEQKLRLLHHRHQALHIVKSHFDCTLFHFDWRFNFF